MRAIDELRATTVDEGESDYIEELPDTLADCGSALCHGHCFICCDIHDCDPIDEEPPEGVEAWLDFQHPPGFTFLDLIR
jgi:hypothetical protein